MRAGGVAAVVVVVVALLPPVPAQAQDVAGALLLIMDSSGSMARADAAGRPLIDGAKDALRGLIGALPAGAPVGLRVYGHRVPNTDQVNGCQDTELIVPVGPLDPAAMSAALDRFTPVDFTPIGLSLQQAAQDLPPEGSRTIVLVSDGEDTCASPDPCQVARDLAAQGVDLRIETIGFYLQGKAVAEQQLRCVADAAGGSYRTADTAAQLAEELRTLSIRALSQYGLQGEPVEGAPAPQQAPVLDPGTYSDSVLNGEARWYAVELEQGDALAVDVTQPGSPHPGGFIPVEIQDPDFRRVERELLFTGPTAETLRVRGPEVGASTGYEPGTYYILMEGADLGEGEVPYDFTLTVEQVQASPSPSPSVEEEPSPSPTPTPEPQASPSPVAVAAGDSGGLSTLAAFLIGVLSAVVVGLAVTLAVVLRRQRRSPA